MITFLNQIENDCNKNKLNPIDDSRCRGLILKRIGDKYILTILIVFKCDNCNAIFEKEFEINNLNVFQKCLHNG